METDDISQAGSLVDQHRGAIRSLYRVQVALGVLGFLLPGILIVNAILSGGFQPSISHTYHTPAGDLLVGVLFAIGLFLFVYKEFNPEDYEGKPPSLLWTKHGERKWARVAGMGAIGVALFPVDPITILDCAQIVASAIDPTCSTGGMTWHGEVSIRLSEGRTIDNILHFLPALLFFTGICVLCFRYFPARPLTVAYAPRQGDEPPKIVVTYHTGRTAMYYVLGTIIALCLAGLLIMTVFEGSATGPVAFLEAHMGFFWFEVIAVVAFATAWLLKSRDYAGI